GFDDLMSRSGTLKYMPKKFRQSQRGIDISALTIYNRIRLALEELGPTYVKLGQMFSNREDLFPPELIAELAQLQDNVPPEPLDLHKVLEEELGIVLTEHFESIETTPIASASISQVYVARLINGQKVIIKIKRDQRAQIIKSDILIKIGRAHV